MFFDLAAPSPVLSASTALCFWEEKRNPKERRGLGEATVSLAPDPGGHVPRSSACSLRPSQSRGNFRELPTPKTIHTPETLLMICVDAATSRPPQNQMTFFAWPLSGEGGEGFSPRECARKAFRLSPPPLSDAHPFSFRVAHNRVPP